MPQENSTNSGRVKTAIITILIITPIFKFSLYIINRSGSSHPKSAGASLRRYNEASLAQHVLDILGTWKSELEKCSLIFYRAVSGNRKILFAKNGKDPAILNREQFG